MMSKSTIGSRHFEDEHGANLLHYAARSGSVPILEYLVNECGLDPHHRRTNGSLPAHDAAAHGHLGAFLWLLNATGTSTADRDNFGHTFLHLASRYVCLAHIFLTFYYYCYYNDDDDDSGTLFIRFYLLVFFFEAFC